MEQLSFEWFEHEPPAGSEVMLSDEAETEVVNLMARSFVVALKEKMRTKTMTTSNNSKGLNDSQVAPKLETE